MTAIVSQSPEEELPLVQTTAKQVTSSFSSKESIDQSDPIKYIQVFQDSQLNIHLLSAIPALLLFFQTNY